MQEKDVALMNEVIRTGLEYNRYRRHIQAVDKLREADKYYQRKINEIIDQVEKNDEEKFFSKLQEVGANALAESKKIKNIFSPDWRKECRRVSEAVQTIFEVKNQNKQQEKEM
ncbi:MAG: hypothetical protein IJ975_02630 [Clostridia bacterium]|nr:hypothetical protein [Clostridia bacterium]